jgi:DNA repair protein RecN (Recombination protein N)
LAVANEEQIVLYNLKEIKVSLQKNSCFSVDYNLFLERVTSITIEFDDELEVGVVRLIYDPVELDRIGQQLQLIYNLQKKASGCDNR